MLLWLLQMSFYSLRDNTGQNGASSIKATAQVSSAVMLLLLFRWEKQHPDTNFSAFCKTQEGSFLSENPQRQPNRMNAIKFDKKGKIPAADPHNWRHVRYYYTNNYISFYLYKKDVRWFFFYLKKIK